MPSPASQPPPPPPLPYIALLDQRRAISELEQIHAHLVILGLAPFSFVASRLLAAFASAGRLSHSAAIFRRIRSPTTFEYNAMLIAHSRSATVEADAGGLLLFARMRSLGITPNARTFPSAVKACFSLFSLAQVHSQILKFGFCGDAYVQSTLINVYSKFRDAVAARRVFDGGCGKDVVIWTSMVSGYCQCEMVDQAQQVFDEMPIRNDVSWGAMAAGYLGNHRYDEVLMVLFRWINEVGVKPYEPLLVSALSACAGLGAAKLGRCMHSFLLQHGFGYELQLGTAMIDFYAKCGCVETARLVFDRMGKKDVTTWSALIMGFAINGFCSLSFHFFELMLKNGIQPNEVTFIAILTACNHGGLVYEGWKYFSLMTDVYLVSPTLEHYGCMVDLMGRAGHLPEAEELVLSMPMQPDAVVLGALLNGCKMHGYLELAEKVGRLLIELDPRHSGRYVGLANTYADIGHWNGVVTVRSMMKERMVSTLPGFSHI